MSEAFPLNSSRHTTQVCRESALKAARELIAVTEHLVEMLEANPSADQWRVLESIVQGMGTRALGRLADPIRQGRTAAVLVQAAERAQAARERAHEDAVVLHLERNGFAQDAEFLSPRPAVHPLLAGALASVQPRA